VLHLLSRGAVGDAVSERDDKSRRWTANDTAAAIIAAQNLTGLNDRFQFNSIQFNSVTGVQFNSVTGG
jgi:hypothetical protein